MGNAASAEAPRKSLKTTNKLSKPQTGKHANNSLLSSNGVSESSRRLSNIEFLPVRPEYSPLSSLLYTPSEAEVALGDVAAGFPGLMPQDRLSRRPSLFRSDSSRGRQGRHDRRGSTGTIASRQASRPPARANSMIVGVPDLGSYENVHAASLSRAGSRRSINYDPTSYASKRLINLVEEPSYDGGSMVSEGQFSVAGSQQQPPEATASLPRAKSEVALYTPMRRRSLLLTPGTATRAATPIISGPSKPRTRHSLPCTPARRESLDSVNVESSTLPFSIGDPASIPRAITPCDTDYQQIGGFKLGTLRITNGSPTRSPARDGDKSTQSRLQPLRPKTDNDYVGSKPADGDAEIRPTNLIYAAGYAETRPTNFRSNSVNYMNYGSGPLPTIQINPTQAYTSAQSPPPRDLRSPFPPESPQLQVTSKHTAMEDDLFEDEQHEFSAVEVLDVRVDLNAKSLPPRPSLVMSESGSISTDLSRADSGIVTSPTTEIPHKPLAKADSGYSSNVSLRSFSSRRRAREQDARQGGVLTHPNTPDYSAGVEGSKSVNMAASEIQGDARSPQLPEKDNGHSLEVPSGISLSRRNLRLLGSFTKRSKSSVSELSTRGEDKADVQSPTTTSGSTLSIDITARKQNTFQRFLTGARRASFSVQATQTHPSAQAGIPPVPQEIQTKLHRRSGSLPNLMRTDMLKSERSRDTLGTIFSVGSAEASADGVVPVSQAKSETYEKISSREAHEQRGNTRTTTTVALENRGKSAAHDATSFATRHLIPRKPVPQRATSLGASNHTRPGVSHNANQPPIHNNSENRHLQGRSLSTTESENKTRPVLSPRQKNPMASSARRSMELRSAAVKDAMNALINEPRFPTLAESPSTTKSPPPVSMKNRSKGHFLSRPKSTPGASAHSGPQPIHGKFYGNAPSVPISHPTSTPITRESSHEKLQESRAFMRSRSFVYQDPSHLLSSPSKMSLRKPPVLKRPQTGEHQVRNWDVQSDRDISRSRKSSFDRDMTYSIGSHSTQGSSAASSRANSIQDHPHQQLNPQLVRHRSSIDSQTGLYMRSYTRENGSYLSSVPRQLHEPVVHANGPSRSHSTSQQWNDPTHHIPAVSRSHGRTRSWGSCDVHGNPLPFRVLHSYNSPAYRNAPIWG